MMRKGTAVIALAVASLGVPAHAQFTLSTGLEYLTGDYGKSSSTSAWQIPLALSYRTGAWTLRLSLPLTRVDGVASTLETEARGSGDGDFIGDDADEDDDGASNVDDADDDNDGVSDALDTDDDNDGIADAADSDDDADGVPDVLESTAAAGSGTGSPGAQPTLRDRRQSGIGDATISAFYTLLDSQSAPVGLELGGKIKLPVASGRKCYLTNGEIDYSVQANIYKSIGRVEPYATIGWTKRGDPQARNADCDTIPGVSVNLRDPLYAMLGLGTRLSDTTVLRVEYEYRQKLRRTSDHKSEARVSLQRRLSDDWRLGAYALTGFSDNSPDWGLGVTVSYRF